MLEPIPFAGMVEIDQMNNEPVFWTCGLEEDEAVSNAIKIKLELEYYNIPLYTHPVKELTERIKKLETALQGWEIGFERIGYERLLKDKDEYIAELLKESAKELTDDEITAISKEIFKDYKNFYHYQIDFARAILRKAQEK